MVSTHVHLNVYPSESDERDFPLVVLEIVTAMRTSLYPIVL